MLDFLRRALVGWSWGRGFQQGLPRAGRFFSRAEVRLITSLEVKPRWFHYTGLYWSTTIPSRVVAASEDKKEIISDFMDLCSMTRGAYVMLEERLCKHQEPQRGYVREHIQAH